MEASLLYDGTFDGFLSAVFYCYEHKHEKVRLQPEHMAQAQLFGVEIKVVTNAQQADRVWKAFKKIAGKSSYKAYYAFLSEAPDAANILLDYFKYVFANKGGSARDYSHPSVLAVAKLAKMVGREKHRMEAFVRFRLTKDQLYFATIEPDFNVLPLIEKHFKARYADQRWTIYDLKRNYGLHYNLKTTEFVHLELPAGLAIDASPETIFTSQELEFQTLWKHYFKSTNIQSRVNMPLHIRHVPKRYWKYLSEKRPD